MSWDENIWHIHTFNYTTWCTEKEQKSILMLSAKSIIFHEHILFAAAVRSSFTLAFLVFMCFFHMIYLPILFLSFSMHCILKTIGQKRQ